MYAVIYRWEYRGAYDYAPVHELNGKYPNTPAIQEWVKVVAEVYQGIDLNSDTQGYLGIFDLHNDRITYNIILLESAIFFESFNTILSATKFRETRNRYADFCNIDFKVITKEVELIEDLTNMDYIEHLFTTVDKTSA